MENSVGKIREEGVNMGRNRWVRLFAAILFAVILVEPWGEAKAADPMDSGDFVAVSEEIPDVLQEIRYFSAYNFVGSHIDGYEEPVALMTREAAAALKDAAAEFRAAGYVIKIYDSYRPQRAVEHFIRWGADAQDIRMKPYFYPTTDKSRVFELGYVAKHSSHSRGSTIDMTLVDMKTGQELNVGEHFDYFGERSHYVYGGISQVQQENRRFLRSVMERHGFKGLVEEWWHFTLNNEPFPDTYFNFPVKKLS